MLFLQIILKVEIKKVFGLWTGSVPVQYRFFSIGLQYLLRTAIAEPIMPAMIMSSKPSPDFVGIGEGVGAVVTGGSRGSGGTGVASVTVACAGVAVGVAVMLSRIALLCVS